jgi:DNA-binding LacI/PurR family transcriptional regulator
MTTIREIADQTGFSIATVSKVLNGQTGVSSATIEIILSAAKELDYRPNLFARNLKKGSSKTLGILVEDITVFNSPAIIDGIGVSCEEHNYHYILGNMRFNKRFGHDFSYGPDKTALVNDMIDEMLSKQVDGIVYVGCHSHNIAPLSSRKNINFVCAYCFSEDPMIPSIVYDDRIAGYRIAELLISKGHTKIGVIAGNKDSWHTNNRLQGFQEALFDHTIPYNPRLTRFGEWDRDHGFSSIPELIDSGATAVFCHNDLIAMGVLDYCNQNNIEAGKDLAIIGFDNREITEVCRPTLSSVSIPLFDIGVSAAQIMFEILEKKKIPEKPRILLECKLIERESTNFMYRGII